mmetsp:Transcript_2904/g.6238  ORF Transcript_2904/g.6238 Transcript_2904/m.6238 type:complete len:205 (+) Transcript_2904:955-1569(+)
MMEELPLAMFANGPACTSTGVASSVCINVGLMASRINAISAPVHPKSSHVTGSPDLLGPTTIFPRRSSMSASDVVMANTAMISDATVMSNPVLRVRPFSVAASPTVISRKKRSFMSTTRRHVMRSSSISKRTNLERSSSVKSSGLVFVIPSFFKRLNMIAENSRVPSFFAGIKRFHSASSLCVASWKQRASTAAASKLFATPMA